MSTRQAWPGVLGVLPYLDVCPRGEPPVEGVRGGVTGNLASSEIQYYMHIRTKQGIYGQI